MYKRSILFILLVLCSTQFSYAQMDEEASIHLDADENKPSFLDARQKHLQRENADIKFPGGTQALKAFIVEHLEYPEIAIENSIEGTVVAKISIDNNGQVRNAYILRPLNEQCDQAVLELIEKMPQWYPQVNNGIAVSNSVILPVTFSLTWN